MTEARKALAIARAIQRDINEVMARRTPKPLDTYPGRAIEATSDCPACGERYLLVHVEPPCQEKTPCIRCGSAFLWHSFNVYCETHRGAQAIEPGR